MKNKSTKELEKLKSKLNYWDWWFIGLGSSFGVLVIGSILYTIFNSNFMLKLLMIPSIIFVICLAFANLGMLYYKFKNRIYAWIIVDIALFFMGLLPFSNIAFYFFWLRPRLKG